MPTAVAEFKSGKTKFDNEIKPFLKANKQVSLAVDAAKDCKSFEKAAAVWDKAKADKDAEKMRAALADLANAAKTYRGKLNAANVKLQSAAKKETVVALQDALEDAGGCLATLSGVVFNVEQTAALTAPATEGEKLTASSFLGDWKAAKKMFKALTGKSKPGPGFLKAFGNSSGLEKAITAMDEASKKNDLAAFDKAFKKFDTTADEYLDYCKKAAKVEVAKTDDEIDGDAMEEADYNTALANLLKGLNRIRTDAKDMLD